MTRMARMNGPFSAKAQWKAGRTFWTAAQSGGAATKAFNRRWTDGGWPRADGRRAESGRCAGAGPTIADLRFQRGFQPRGGPAPVSNHPPRVTFVLLPLCTGINLYPMNHGATIAIRGPITEKRNPGSCLPQAVEEGLPRSTARA